MFKQIIYYLKNSFIKNGKLDWDGILYFVSMPIGFVSCIASIILGLKLYRNVENFHLSELKIPFLLMLMFAFKIPYVTDKPVALLSFSANSFGWFISFLIFILVFMKSKEVKRKNNHLSLLNNSSS
jgi:hypothetical protein